MEKNRSAANDISLVYCDAANNVYDYPDREPVFRSARRFVTVHRADLIKLPYGSLLFSLPGRYPVYFDHRHNEYLPIREDMDGAAICGASSFLSSGYLRTYLPGFIRGDDSAPLPLWAYCGVVLIGDDFHVPALRIDDDPRSDPAIHENDAALSREIAAIKKIYPDNRLVGQLSVCATEYRCLCSRNFFLGRHEAPIPTSPACNSRCIGCLSHQSGSGFCQSQFRIEFAPTPEEISQVMLHHIGRVEKAVVSFGQGCEGEPLLRGDDLARAIARVRSKTGAGTINCNTNGSLPDRVQTLIDAGLDSIRVSLNSPTQEYYTRYFRPVNFSFADIERTLDIALSAGIFVSINLFFMPGFTDMESEMQSLLRFLERFPVNMIQARNLNIDPDLYLDSIDYRESRPLGVATLVQQLQHQFPRMKIGYYNPPKENF